MGYTILFVEDDADVRESTEAILTHAGFRLLVAKNGYEALSLLAENDVDVLFTDIVMPGMDGVELAKQARQKHPEIRVLFVTAYSPRAADAAKLGRLMLKPVGRRQIIDELSALLAA
jgi:CheY-like chemotaxis protein